MYDMCTASVSIEILDVTRDLSELTILLWVLHDRDRVHTKLSSLYVDKSLSPTLRNLQSSLLNLYLSSLLNSHLFATMFNSPQITCWL
jgi:hypothetical protein